MIWKLWVLTPVSSNLGCMILLSKSYLIQKTIRLPYCALGLHASASGVDTFTWTYVVHMDARSAVRTINVLDVMLYCYTYDCGI